MSISTRAVLSATLADLQSSGFGFLDHLQEDGLFVRLTRTEGSTRERSRYRYEILTPFTELNPSRVRHRQVVKWWKSRLHADAVRKLITKHALYSLDLDQEFILNGNDELVPRTQKTLTL